MCKDNIKSINGYDNDKIEDKLLNSRAIKADFNPSNSFEDIQESKLNNSVCIDSIVSL